jgi:hypothetical protein
MPKGTLDHESHIDGCDLDFTAGELTPDADLPPARGGVDPLPRARAATRAGRSRRRVARSRVTKAKRTAAPKRRK